MFAHGGKHVITVHPMVEIVQPKDCLSISIGLASRSFTNFFSQDLFSEMHPLGGGFWGWGKSGGNDLDSFRFTDARDNACEAEPLQS